MIEVGKIQDWPVQYIPERRVLFCKNTAISLDKIELMLRSSLSRERDEAKNLTIVKLDNIVQFGCLTTTLDNVENIRKNIKNYERNSRR